MDNKEEKDVIVQEFEKTLVSSQSPPSLPKAAHPKIPLVKEEKDLNFNKTKSVIVMIPNEVF